LIISRVPEVFPLLSEIAREEPALYDSVGGGVEDRPGAGLQWALDDFVCVFHIL